jgi:hypothetical protein
MPVFQPAPMRRWSPLVFSESDMLSYSPPLKIPNDTLKINHVAPTLKPYLPTPNLSDTTRPFSGNLHSGEWFATW